MYGASLLKYQDSITTCVSGFTLKLFVIVPVPPATCVAAKRKMVFPLPTYKAEYIALQRQHDVKEEQLRYLQFTKGFIYSTTCSRQECLFLNSTISSCI